MNRIWLAIGLTVAMIVLCGVLLFSADRITDEMTDRLEELRDASPDSVQVQQKIDDLCSRWEQHEKSLTLHVRHSEIEEVTYALTQMKSSWEMGEYELFVMACDEALVSVEHLWEAARPSLKNII